MVYYFVTVLFTTGLQVGKDAVQFHFASWLWFLVLIVFPAVTGLGLGILEAGDALGRVFRRLGVRLPSPTPTAWETLFRELAPGAVILVTLKDGAIVAGRWIGGRGGSAASTDANIMDLYIGEIGEIDNEGRYVPKRPHRGAYIAAEEIRFFEVIPV